jgi:hypothetical protein
MRGIRWAGTLLMMWGFVAFTVSVPGCVPAGAEIGGGMGGGPTIGADMVPDPAYSPRVGDRAMLYALDNGYPLDRLPVLKDLTAYDIYVRSRNSGDNERLFELEQQGWLQWALPGTRVSVLDTQDRNHAGAQTATQIKIPDESHKNQSFWVPSGYITRLIHKEPE